jgi:acetolactate synthase-1/2/3 large subunit
LRSGGEILIDSLIQLGCDTAFGVPGESYLAALDAMTAHNQFRFVVCRQEGGAAMMADAYARVTGKPGVCFVTRGPGATNASAGIHISQQDSVPVILFVGQVGRDMMEREAFQEIDYRRMFGPLTKWVAQIDEAERIPEFLSHAYHVAQQGRPGPVVLALPEDMLTEKAEAPALEPVVPAQPHAGPRELARLAEILGAAQRPLAILGGGGWTVEAGKQVEAFAERHGLPLSASFRCQHLIDNEHPCYVGHVGIGIEPTLAEAVRDADLLLVLGARLGEMTTSGYTLVKPTRPDQALVHVHPGSEEIGRVYQPALGINAAMPGFAAALAEIDLGAASWGGHRDKLRAAYEVFRQPVKSPGPLQLSRVVTLLDELLPAETIHCNGAGNYSIWVHRFHPYRAFASQLAPTSGSMGYGTPAAVGAKIARPEATVVAWAGDGCFMMHGQELATAVQYGLKMLILVINNGQYGTIRMHQEREYPGRVSGTQLANPDFAALARAYGAYGAAVERDEEVEPALKEALAFNGPALIELRVDPEVITPATTLSALREAALARQKG